MYQKERLENKKMIEKKKALAQQSQSDTIKSLTQIQKTFQENLHTFAAKHKDKITKDPDFRDKFNELCDKMDVNPMLSRKSMWTDLGYGDFYNELAIKILDICAKKQSITGGINKIDDIKSDFMRIYKMKVTRQDLERALKTIDSLGGCSIQNNYIYTVPIEMSPDFTKLIEVAEKHGFVNAQIMAKENWSLERFSQKIEILQAEGLVWIDKKTRTIPNYYFPSMMNSYFQQ